jgi:hypothetical protein
VLEGDSYRLTGCGGVPEVVGTEENEESITDVLGCIRGIPSHIVSLWDDEIRIDILSREADDRDTDLALVPNSTRVGIEYLGVPDVAGPKRRCDGGRNNPAHSGSNGGDGGELHDREQKAV